MARYSTDGLYSSMYPTSAKERMLASSCRKVNGQSAACPATDAAMLEGGQCASSSSNQMRRARSVESKEDSMLAAGGAMMMDHGGAGVVRCDMNSHNANRFSGRGDKLSEIRSSLEPYASGDPPGRHPMKLNEESLHVLMQMGFDQGIAVQALQTTGGVSMQECVTVCQQLSQQSAGGSGHRVTVGRSNSFNSTQEYENQRGLGRAGAPRGSVHSGKEAPKTTAVSGGAYSGVSSPVNVGGRPQQPAHVASAGIPVANQAAMPPVCNPSSLGVATSSVSTVSADHDAAAFTRQAHQRASFRSRMLQHNTAEELYEDRELGAAYARAREDGLVQQGPPGQQYRTQSPIARNTEARRSGRSVKRESPLTVPATAYAQARGVSPRTIPMYPPGAERTSPYTVGIPATSPYTVGPTTSPPRRKSAQFVYGSEEEPPRYEDTPASQALKRQSPLQPNLQSPVHMQHTDPPAYHDAVYAVDSGVEYGPSPTSHLQQPNALPSGVGQQHLDQRRTPPVTADYTMALELTDHQLVPNTHHTNKIDPAGNDVDEEEDPEVADLIEKAEALGKSVRYRSRALTSSQSDPLEVHTCTPQQFKFYMEQHVENVLRSLKERQARRMQLEREMSRYDLGNETRDQMLRILRVKESNYLRVKRSKMDRSQFEKLNTLGVGSFGEVALVRKVDTRKLYAMKTLKKKVVLKRNQAAHVKAERDILAEADNEWVVKLFYSFQDRHNLYFVMEYIPGGDMMSLLIKLGMFPEDLARFYIAELVIAVDSVHSVGFIHRDIKPDNILIGSDGHIKLTDFGLCTGFRWTHDSKYYQDESAPAGHQRQGSMDIDPEAWEKMKKKCHCSEAEMLKPLEMRRRHQRCMAHSLVGTPNYIAPEILGRQPYNKLVDWWSVGVILYEMIVGRPPFLAASPMETQLKVMDFNRSLVIPRSTNISSAADDLLRKLLCQPSQRLGKTDEDLKGHPFFVGINWNTDPRAYAAPYIPTIRHSTDTSNFDPVPPNHAHSASIDDTPHTSHAFYEFTFRRFFHDDLLPNHGGGGGGGGGNGGGNGRYPAGPASASASSAAANRTADTSDTAYVEMSSAAMRNNISPLSGYCSSADGPTSTSSAMSQYYDTSTPLSTAPVEDSAYTQTALPHHQPTPIDSTGLATYV